MYVVSGREFNKIYENKLCVKLLHQDLTHHGYIYRNGLNCIRENELLNITNECCGAGLYFCLETDINKWLQYFNANFSYVEVPDDATVVIECDKFKTDKFVLKQIQPIYKNIYLKLNNIYINGVSLPDGVMIKLKDLSYDDCVSYISSHPKSIYNFPEDYYNDYLVNVILNEDYINILYLPSIHKTPERIHKIYTEKKLNDYIYCSDIFDLFRKNFDSELFKQNNCCDYFKINPVCMDWINRDIVSIDEDYIMRAFECNTETVFYLTRTERNMLSSDNWATIVSIYPSLLSFAPKICITEKLFMTMFDKFGNLSNISNLPNLSNLPYHVNNYHSNYSPSLPYDTHMGFSNWLKVLKVYPRWIKCDHPDFKDLIKDHYAELSEICKKHMPPPTDDMTTSDWKVILFNIPQYSKYCPVKNLEEIIDEHYDTNKPDVIVMINESNELIKWYALKRYPNIFEKLKNSSKTLDICIFVIKCIPQLFKYTPRIHRNLEFCKLAVELDPLNIKHVDSPTIKYDILKLNRKVCA